MYDHADILYEDLIVETKRGNLEEVKKLVALGADVRNEDDEVLYFAADKGHLEILKFFVESGCDIHAQVI